jgi:hypothetical protein
VPEPQSAPDSALDRLWKEYGKSFAEFDDLTLARWSSQTLGQLHGRAWRLSHPLVGCFRLAAQVAHERGLWHQRLVNFPAGYNEAPCCRAPLLPLFTREVAELGLLCQHCGETAVPYDDIPAEVRPKVKKWADEYGAVHEIAHWDEKRQKKDGDYDRKFEDAAQGAEELLAAASHEVVPLLLEYYPSVIWEDQDECLEVRPEDVVM